MFEKVLFRDLDVQPTLNQHELTRIKELSSLLINEFYFNGDIRFLTEKEVLYKGNRLLEKYLDDMLEIQKTHDCEAVRIRIYYCTLKLGHICLLAQDWTRALSAYQRAYLTKRDLFCKDPDNYFGIGLVYTHFKENKLAVEAFNKLLYAFPMGPHVIETKTRLAVCYQNIDEYARSIKFYNQSLTDTAETPFMSKFVIRFNIAMCLENSNELLKAESEYKKVLEDLESLVKKDHDGEMTPEQLKLQAAIYRQMGWVEYRKSLSDDHEKAKHLKEAEMYLKKSKDIESADGKSYYFLGRCHGENDANAHEAFCNYRQSIDKNEANADTWCSIGALYQKQNQPMDALQAFICAVELDPGHFAAWTNLGELYDKNEQFFDALECFRFAAKHNPCAPDPLKARIAVLEKEFAVPVPQRPPPSPQSEHKALPSLKEAWTQPIPSELRKRQDDFYKVKEQKYRDGSPLWKMGDLAAPIGEQIEMPLEPLDEEQKQVMILLEANQKYIKKHEKDVYDALKTKSMMVNRQITDHLLEPHVTSDLPKFTEADVAALRETGHLANASSSDTNEEKVTAETSTVTTKPISDLPTTFNLLSNINVSYDITAQEILTLSAKRTAKAADFRPVFDEEARPPSPPIPPKAEVGIDETTGRNKLLRPTPLLLVDSRKDAQSLELQKFCENAPIALIRGLTSVLKMDLSLFSTKSLLELSASDEMEVRTQYRLPSDVNVDYQGSPSWECFSSAKYTTITKYSQYQAETFKHSLKEESQKLRNTGAKYQTVDVHGAKRRRLNNGEESYLPLKTLKFGTNVDLSDDVKYKNQLQELSKMPAFCRLIAGGNMLSHLGFNVLGMNTVQLYMKVPGSRTPAHQENNNFASININIGPGDCEWFGVPYEYWGVVEKLCRKHNVDYLKGSYWPDIKELLSENVPLYRFTQKAGDMVWVGGGCVHWVQATGWCNNIAWNVGPINYSQLAMAVHSYEWNKLHSYKSLVPIQHLAWQLAKNVHFTNQSVYTFIRGLLIRSLSFCKIVIGYAEANGKQLKPQSRTKGEVNHYCNSCEVEVFNILFVREEKGKFPVFCVYCAKSKGIEDFLVLQQVSMSDLTTIFDGMVLKTAPKVQLSA